MMETARVCRFAVGIFSVFAAGCDAASRPASRTDHQILFLSAPVHPTETNWFLLDKDVYRMNVDGTDPENLSRLPADYESLALSPDRRTVAFHSDRDNCLRIWAMNVDGSNIRQLTTGIFGEVRCNRTPRWSRDGSRIAFSTTREGTFSVYVMDADGTNLRNVSHPVDDLGGHTFPVTWSPDGKVVFHHFVSGAVEAYIVNADGTDLGPLFGRTGDRSPAWSRDGSMVAFIRDEGERSSLFVMSSDGSNVRRLTDHAGNDELAVGLAFAENQHSHWSPDGTRIAFSNVIDFQVALDVIKVDGSDYRRLIEHSMGAEFNGWTPDGRILFSSEAAGTADVYLINADGTGLAKLTGDTTHDRNAMWVSSP